MERAVLRYLHTHANPVWPDDMAEDLGVSVLAILEALESLRRKGRVREVRAGDGHA